MFKKEASRHPEIFQDRFSAIRALNRQFVENTINILEFFS